MSQAYSRSYIAIMKRLTFDRIRIHRRPGGQISRSVEPTSCKTRARQGSSPEYSVACHDVAKAEIPVIGCQSDMPRAAPCVRHGSLASLAIRVAIGSNSHQRSAYWCVPYRLPVLELI